MFLPHNLASSVRHSKRSKKLQPQRTLSEESQPQPSPPRSLMSKSWARISRRSKRKRAKQEHSNGVTASGCSLARNNDIQHCSLDQQQSCRSSGAINAVGARTEDAVFNDREKGNFVFRGMDKLRRSIRKSFRRTKSQMLAPSGGGNASGGSTSAGRGVESARTPATNVAGMTTVETAGNSAHNGKTYCQPDEAAVRLAACSFHVKYLGAVEVFESRGMHVCEAALQQLRMKKRQTKAILYVTGDGLRVVDQESNRGLILDQTIEKVSFCSPDRHNDRGFAYICREGATKRWMCHGFQSTKETGERLSHAVGCAFNICLEKKRKRDAETAAYKSGQALALITNASANNFDRAFESAAMRSSLRGTKETNGVGGVTNDGSTIFRRQLSIAERKMDPQTAIIVRNNAAISAPPPTTTTVAAAAVTTTSGALTLAATTTTADDGVVAPAGVGAPSTSHVPTHTVYSTTTTVGGGGGVDSNVAAGDGSTSAAAAPVTDDQFDPTLRQFSAPIARTVGAVADAKAANLWSASVADACVTSSIAKPRPVANPSLFDRQGSFKAPLQQTHPNNSFKRFNSLRADLIGYSDENRSSGLKTIHNEPIYEGDDENNSSAELCSLNFNNFNTNALMAAPAVNALTDTPKRSMHTSQSFCGNGNVSSEFTADRQFGDKRASRADEWLEQILQTSTAVAPSIPLSSSAVVNTWNIQLSSLKGVNSLEQEQPQMVGYINPATQMTPSGSLVGIESARISHSISAGAFAFGNVGSDGTLPLSARSAGSCGPPPNQPPPPLPPSVANRRQQKQRSNAINDVNFSPKNDIAFKSDTAVSTCSNQKRTTTTSNTLPGDSLEFVQTLMKSQALNHEMMKTGKNNDQTDGGKFGDSPNSSKIPSHMPRGSSNVATRGMDATLKEAPTVSGGHARKSSAARMSIEYQLLEETDVPPQSPPRYSSPIQCASSNALHPLQITQSISLLQLYNHEFDSFGQRVFGSPSSSSSNNATTSTTIAATNSTSAKHSTTAKSNGGDSMLRGAGCSSKHTITMSPTAAASAEAAIQAIRLATLSSLESAESAISALHNSTKSDDPFDVKWSTEVLQKSTLHKISTSNNSEGGGGEGRLAAYPTMATTAALDH